MKKIGRCCLLCIFMCSASSENVGTPFAYVTPEKESYFDIAMEMQDKYNIPASIILAQFILESNFCQSKLAVETNNCFGIKCKSRCKKPGHCKNMKDDFDSDRFFVYPNVKASFEHHSKVLSRGRYIRFRFDFKLDWEKWCDGLQSKGYATDKAYSRTLKQIIKKNKLYEYDKDATKQGFGPEMWIAGLDRGSSCLRP